MAVAAAACSGALIGVSAVLDVHIERPLALFLDSTFAMTAVGVTALTINSPDVSAVRTAVCLVPA